MIQQPDALTAKLFRAYYKANLVVRRKSYEYLWILGHMRSGSSMFTHILNTNPEISGYGETHVFYWNQQDLTHLMCDVKYALKQLDMSDRFIMDKILHDMHIKDESLLNHPRISIIFLLRDPAETLSSMVKLWGETGDDGVQLYSVEDYTQYYCDRLRSIQRYAEIMEHPKRAFFLTHAQLIHQTEAIFRALEQHLALKFPLSEQYEKTPVTGQRKVGDWSGNLESGTIIRNPKKTLYNLDPHLLERANQAFQDCCQTLSQRCTSLPISQDES
ncbi:MAG: sulfotransferase [Elainellaceae cyanobacterium]|jgi:hypothetical protein